MDVAEGLAVTVKAVLLDVVTMASTFIITAVPAELLIVTATPALPTGVEAPSTTEISVLEVMLHDDASMPVEGVLPTFAEHVRPGVNPVPAKVIVLPWYTAEGLTLDALGAAFMVNEPALFGPSMVAAAAFLVVTTAIAIVPAVP